MLVQKSKGLLMFFFFYSENHVCHIKVVTAKDSVGITLDV
jgi:hypothetical protein